MRMEESIRIGLCSGRVHLMTKYGIDIPKEIIEQDVNRLTNQLWKLIPMRENNENWEGQLKSVIVELTGINQIFDIDIKYLILLAKLEGLKNTEIEFSIYRKTVFESISLLREIYHGK